MGYFRQFACGLAGLCLVGHARADSSTGAIAQALYDQAKKLMATGAFAEACPKLQESQRLDPGGGTILLLARCHAKEGKTATAWVEYQEAQRTAVRDNRKEREKIAREEGAAVEARLSRLIIEVGKPTVTPGLSIQRDGLEVGPAQWSLAVAVDPGRHQIVASAPGRVTWTKTFDVPAERSLITVAVEPLPLAKAELAVAAPPSVPEKVVESKTVEDGSSNAAQTGSGTALRIAGAVVAGAGIVTVGAGAYFGMKAKAANDESYELGCVSNECPPEGDARRRASLDHADVSTILFAAGAAAIVTGATLWLVAPKDEAPAVALGMGPHHIMLRGTW